jgi:isopenicillin N synthase-like dioxygenase
MKQTLGDEEQHVAVNLYPEPELTSGGLPAHTDPDALTILLMDQDVAGLQVLHGGGKQWVTVNPLPGALVISIGDQLRALAKRSRGLSTIVTGNVRSRFGNVDQFRSNNRKSFLKERFTFHDLVP